MLYVLGCIALVTFITGYVIVVVKAAKAQEAAYKVQQCIMEQYNSNNKE